MANNFSFRFKQFTQRLRETTQLPQFFAEQTTSETQNLARDLASVGEYATQLSQVVMEVDFINQLYTRLLNEREVLQQEKDNLEARVFELQQERNETEPQVMYLREQLSQASFQLEQTQNRERSLSERERQLAEIVAQLERRRAVLNQAIENLTNQEADYTVRTKELEEVVYDNEKKAKQYLEAANHYRAYLEELNAQVEETQAKLRSLGVEPKPADLPRVEDMEKPTPIPTPPPPAPPEYMPPMPQQPPPPQQGGYWSDSPFGDDPWG
jgi:chromosome segregation ATPase